MKVEFSQHIFETSSNTKFDQDPPSRNRAVSCGQKDVQIDAFRNFANALKILHGAHIAFVFCIDLRTNRDFHLTHQSLVDLFYNRGEEC
jgi:hypothetical protein